MSLSVVERVKGKVRHDAVKLVSLCWKVCRLTIAAKGKSSRIAGEFSRKLYNRTAREISKHQFFYMNSDLKRFF